MGKAGSSRDGAPCLVVEIVLPVCGHRASKGRLAVDKMLFAVRLFVVSFPIIRYSDDNNLQIAS